ncbi:LAFA_0D11672g1_1 [Lachancea sp. 'fantastica']|nr:LAFA_0D11672g1_1 [Lachancea sp. 'fantastica']
MSIYQNHRTMSSDTLVGLHGNNSRVDLNTSTNGDSTFNLQLVQNPKTGSSIANNLTGNTLQTSSRSVEPERQAMADSSLLEEMLYTGNSLKEELQEYNNSFRPREPTASLFQIQEHRRLSISEYHSAKPMHYYEYEFFEKGRAVGEDEGTQEPEEEDEDEKIMVTDDEGPELFQFSPRRQNRKDSVFSDYGNEMAMNLADTTVLASIPVPQQQFYLEDDISQDPIRLPSSDGQYKKKVKDYFKINFFAGERRVPEALVNPQLLDTDPQPFLKKKYFWSRKPTVPISARAFLDDSEPVVNPSKLHTSSNLENHYSLGSSGTTLGSSENSQSPPELSVEAGLVKKKRLGIPKTRGRKPSPILDSSKHFACEFCDRRFKRQEHLKRHVRSLHMGEKPFGCQICGKKFSRSDNLNQHVKTHQEGELS